MNTTLKIPFYAKASLFLIGLYVFISMLAMIQGIILPVIYATIIAILVSPLVNFLVKKKISRVLAITFVLIISILIVTALIGLLSSQASRFREALPHLTFKFQELLDHAVIWSSGYFNISTEKINVWIANIKTGIINNSSVAIGNTLTTMGGVLVTAFLTPVYIFMILFYQPHLVAFTHKLFGTGNNNKVTEILLQTKSIIQSYIVGLFAEFVIVASLNSVGLLILGIDYAILLGIILGLLNVIPYLGGVLGVALVMVIALLTKSPVYVLYVFALYALIQFIDNNFIVPKVVGSKVKLNALVCLIAVIAGAALWGIPGMLLSIPLIAIIKLILDRIESLKSWGFLLGNVVPTASKLKFNFIKKKKKISELKFEP